jgi:regulator of CtrA degradation
MTMLAQFAPTTLARRYLDTHKFADLYREVMTVVETTANYLDNQGRTDRRVFNRSQDLTYSRASMQLTTQLMQIAGHALVLRDVASQKMDLEDAMEKIAQSKIHKSVDNDITALVGMPKGLVDLCEAGNRLRARLLWVHEGLAKENIEPLPVTNGVHDSLAALNQAFS